MEARQGSSSLGLHPRPPDLAENHAGGSGRGSTRFAQPFPKGGKAKTVASGEGDTCKTIALESFDQMGPLSCINAASPLFSALRLHGCNLTLWNPRV
jgi:hypothetical protein